MVVRESELAERLDAVRRAARARCLRIVVEESGAVGGDRAGIICAEIDEGA